MSEVRVNNIVDYGGKGAPTFDNGAVISGVSSLGNQAKIGSNVTITSGGINVSGVTTAATLSGNLTGDVNSGFVTATSTVIGSGVTINAGGLNITGVMTATTFEGSGASMTGVAMTITPLAYNPDVSDSTVPKASGIGITFDHRILAGSGNVTLSIANAGVAGTVVENFGVGSSVTISGRKAIIDPTSDLNNGETYHISYPSGAFTNTGGDVSYVGTAYTFGVKPQFTSLFAWGYGGYGTLGLNSPTQRSSPTQVPGDNWATLGVSYEHMTAVKADGTLWSWGRNQYGQVGQNNTADYSSPIQIPGTTWSTSFAGYRNSYALKTDGTLWGWGVGEGLGQNQPDNANHSSPIQIPGTTWTTAFDADQNRVLTTKTDGTLWTWGSNNDGKLGQNNTTPQSSPIQIPGTTWGTTMGKVSCSDHGSFAIKTDGTLWVWGDTAAGALGLNTAGNNAKRSSPIQVPGTTWKEVSAIGYGAAAIKTDGTLWTWGSNNTGELGVNDKTQRSSPIQVPGTTWDRVESTYDAHIAIKTDGTLWSWGNDNYGKSGHNDKHYSSPVQIPGTTWSLSNINANHYTNSSAVMFKEV